MKDLGHTLKHFSDTYPSVLCCDCGLVTDEWRAVVRPQTMGRCPRSERPKMNATVKIEEIENGYLIHRHSPADPDSPPSTVFAETPEQAVLGAFKWLLPIGLESESDAQDMLLRFLDSGPTISTVVNMEPKA